MEGYIWFHQKMYSGTKNDFLEFQKKIPDCKLIMRMYVSSLKEVENIADNLNNSNIVRELKNRS